MGMSALDDLFDDANGDLAVGDLESATLRSLTVGTPLAWRS
jgi:hypothetical protein